MKPLGKENVHYYGSIDLDVAPCYDQMSKVGLKIDTAKLASVKDAAEKELAGYAGELAKFAGMEKFVPHSAAHIKKLLTVMLGRPYTGSTAKPVVDMHVRAHPELGPVMEILQKAKKCQHLASMARSVMERVSGNHVYPTYIQDPELGRPHCADPNYMNWTTEIKQAVVARPGYKIMVVDFKAQEVRVLIALSGDTKLMEAMEGDFHRRVAAMCLGKLEDKVTDQERKEFKAVTFGIMYGTTAEGLEYNMGIPLRRAEEILAAWKRTFHVAYDYLDSMGAEAFKNGVLLTAHGRPRDCEARLKTHLPQIKGTPEDYIRRLGKSHCIQSTAADLMKIGLINLKAAENGCLNGAVVFGTVHDSYLVEIPEEWVMSNKRLKLEIEHCVRHEVLGKNDPRFREFLDIGITVSDCWDGE